MTDIATRAEQAKPEEARAIVDYLARLADWAAGQGFCQIDGLEDPDEWVFRMWQRLGPPNGNGYSVDAFAASISKAIGQ